MLGTLHLEVHFLGNSSELVSIVPCTVTHTLSSKNPGLSHSKTQDLSRMYLKTHLSFTTLFSGGKQN